MAFKDAVINSFWKTAKQLPHTHLCGNSPSPVLEMLQSPNLSCSLRDRPVNRGTRTVGTRNNDFNWKASRGIWRHSSPSKSHLLSRQRQAPFISEGEGRSPPRHWPMVGLVPLTVLGGQLLTNGRSLGGGAHCGVNQWLSGAAIMRACLLPPPQPPTPASRKVWRQEATGMKKYLATPSRSSNVIFQALLKRGMQVWEITVASWGSWYAH